MIIDWTKIALNIYNDIKEKVSKLNKKPTLWAILVWKNPESLRYINQKRKWAIFVWINFKLLELDENITEKELLNHINNFNNDINISWYIIQLPLPKNINQTNIINSISPKKDIDWFHPENIWKILIWDKSWFIPCTPAWVMKILEYQKINLEWKAITVIGRSNIVWKPLIALLINAWATVTACNSKTRHLEKDTSRSDIIISAAWVPGLLKVNMMRIGTVVIDVWFTIIDGKILWDADFKNIEMVWNTITPVPGWVWALTVAMLMSNTLKAEKLK